MDLHELVRMSYESWHAKMQRGLERLKNSPLYKYMRPKDRPVLIHKVTLIWLCRV